MTVVAAFVTVFAFAMAMAMAMAMAVPVSFAIVVFVSVMAIMVVVVVTATAAVWRAGARSGARMGGVALAIIARARLGIVVHLLWCVGGLVIESAK